MKVLRVLNSRIFLLVSILGLFLCLPLLAQAEEIKVFESDIYIYEDGTFGVTETITYDFGSLQKHGIFRDIAHRHPQESSSWFKERTIDVEVEMVTRDGEAEPFTVNYSRNKTSVKIGDPDKTISGKHTYLIHYHVTGGLSYFDDGQAEIYWNATGNEWPATIKQVVVNLWGPEGVLLSDRACYKGIYGSNSKCDMVSDINNGSVFIASGLAPGAGITVAQSIDPNLVPIIVVEKFNFIILLLLYPVFLLVMIFLLVYHGLKYRNFHKTDVPIVAQYEPYENVLPMYAGYLFDNQLHTRDLTAAIIYLAQQGHIKIKKVDRSLGILLGDDFEVTYLEKVDAAKYPFMYAVLLLLFDSLDDVGKTIKMSALLRDKTKGQGNYYRRKVLKANLKQDLAIKGFREKTKLYQSVKKMTGLTIMVGVGLGGIFLITENSYVGLVLLALIPVFGIVLITDIVFSSRLTAKGFEAKNHMLGFKDFLSVTDEERFNFHNAPEKNPETFMKYLPYAIAFGVEIEWAKVFKGIDIPPPDWYSGPTGTAFVLSDLTSGLNSFSNSFASSGASGSSSGSGGGGFSGGGGGGGGGGSW